MEEQKYEEITLELDDDTYQRIVEGAKELNISIDEYVNKVVKQFLENFKD